jgi:hypothetical protein
MKPSTLSLLAAGLVLSGAGLQAETPKLILNEDFESTPAGEIPKGFTKTGAVVVVDDMAHSGKKSLRIEPATRGARKITLEGEKVAALGGEHWGRLYYKVKLPAPAPVIPEGKTTGIIHSTLVSGNAISPSANDAIEMRLVGNLLRTDGTFRYLFNVQPRKERKEFGKSNKAPSTFSDQWVLVEWHVNNADQSYHFYVNGEEQKDITVENGAGNFTNSEIPAVFKDLSFGWTNYQPATAEGFTAWIDDLALGKERIGPAGTGKTAAK